MIVSFKDMLQNATDGKYAVGAFNIGNKDILDATIAAAEEKKIPAIVAVSVPEMNFLGDELCKSTPEKIGSPILFTPGPWFKFGRYKTSYQ